ncbi:hypothetical protein Dtox_4248 [Desulfofarcimen acetoxidans DSM 771]|uniref:Uncharacterized protein n=1 Tax=Desulfofarcimen acetoxidans (strain ATCC 49208 / DSM 771 / KCTC 5769 / VKM B-1644 / 5575) TaxID=485916 RepID=C8VZH0_DESAS|nr:hypothetical protein [Desulfofarcimen acetoxidans]ACV64915.1 hypothetical protein Dtox_4248 [Desulfofarcimen acetoxidans DSM 771]
MPDPFKQLASILEMRMAGHVARSVSGVLCELGTITASGLKLDSFKHEIQDYLVADWLVKIHFPVFSLVGTATSPVNDQGIDLPGAKTTSLTRYDFLTREVDEVHLELKADIKPGDRVLAVPVNGGQDAVVIAKVIANA